MSFKELKKLVTEDEAYSSLVSMTKKTAKVIDCERVKREARTLHEGRTSRNLYKVKMSPIPLYEATTTDLSHRSRLVTLKAPIAEARQLLSAAVSKTKSHITSKYQGTLSAWSNAQGRNAAVDRCVAHAQEFLDELEATEATLDMFIKDIDQASYSLGHAVSVLKVLVERKGQVV